MFNLPRLGKRIEEILGGFGNQANRTIGGLGQQANNVGNQAQRGINQIQQQATNAARQNVNVINRQVQQVQRQVPQVDFTQLSRNIANAANPVNQVNQQFEAVKRIGSQLPKVDFGGVAKNINDISNNPIVKGATRNLAAPPVVKPFYNAFNALDSKRTNDMVDSGGNFVKDMAVATARAVPQGLVRYSNQLSDGFNSKTASDAQEQMLRQGNTSITPQNKEYKPNSSVEKFIFGDKPIGNMQDYANEMANVVGMDKLHPAVGLPLGFALTAGDVFVTGGGKKAVTESLSKADDAKKVLQVINKDKNLAKLTDDVKASIAPQLAKITDTKQIDDVLQQAFQSKPKVTLNVPENPLLNEARKYKSAADYQYTTGDPKIDAQIKQVAEMSPDEYLKQAFEATDGKLGGSYDSWLKSNAQDAMVAKRYAEAMQNGDKFPIAYIDKAMGSQDGRNRALAAKLAGRDKMPVGIIPEMTTAEKIAFAEAQIKKYPEKSYLGNKYRRELTDLYNQATKGVESKGVGNAVTPLKEGETYSMANGDISRNRSPGMNQDGFNYGPDGARKGYIGVDKLSTETRNRLRRAEANYEAAKRAKNGTALTASEELDKVYSDVIKELGLEQHATIVGADGGIVQRVESARYGDWVEQNWRSGKYSDEAIKDMEANPNKYIEQFRNESSTKSTPVVESKGKPKVELKTPSVAQAVPSKPKVALKGEYKVGDIKSPQDFENEVARMVKDTGVTPDQAKINVQNVLENARVASVSGTPRIVNPDAPTEITGRVTKNKDVKDILTGFSKAQGSSGVEGSQVAASIATRAKQLGVKLDQGFTDRYQAGRPLNEAEQTLGKHIKGLTDALFEKQKALNPEIAYRKNYVPQTYAQSEQAVSDAARKLQKQTGAALPRAFNTYQEAAQFGLTPKHTTIDQMIGEGAATAEKTFRNRELVETGLKSGIFTNNQSGVPLTGIADSSGNQLYAQKKVADIINNATQQGSGGLDKGLHMTARAFETTQDVLLQGGIPGTNANFFVAGQAVKDTTRNIGKAPLHPIQAVKQEGNLIGDLFRGKTQTQQRFSEGTFKAGGKRVNNSDFVKQLADEGLYIQPQTSLSGAGKSKLRQGWNTLGNNPTFGRYMPNRLLSTAQEVYSQSVGKIGHKKAIKLAAETTKTFTGHVDTIAKGRSTRANDLAGIALFAPKYRESIIGALTNVVKSTFPNNWRNPAYKPSRQLLAGMAVTLGGYELLNRQITGHSMMENRQGQELSLEIPYGEKDEKGNQQVLNIPFMPGFMTIPRAAFGAATALARGDVKGVGAEASKALSAPLQTAGSVLANKDYFGRPIYNDQETADLEGVNPDNALEAGGKIAAYVGGQFSPAWIRGIIGAAQEKPAEQNIAVALEAPVRFGKRINPETTAYFKDRDEVYASLDKNDRAVWDSVFPKSKNVNGEYIADRSIDYGAARAINFLDRPKVLEAANEMARRAKSRGQKVDPLFDTELLTPEQQRIALRIATLPPKDPQSKVLKMDNPWYRPLSDARSKFFDSLPPGDPNKPKGPIEYPEPSAEVAAKQDAYYQLTDSKMKRDFITNNQDLVEQMAKEEQYSRGVRAMKNLPQYDKYPEPDKGTQELIDQYMSLPQKESNGKSRARSAWIKSHPNEWNKIGDAFDKIAQYNLEQDIQIAAFEGHDITDKGIKAIASLGGSSGSSGYSRGSGGSGGGSGSDGFNPYKYNVSMKTGKINKPTVKMLAGGTKISAVKSGAPKVSIKKSKV